jgi:flagellar motility protein MotE (MotC chaperone)
MPHPRFLRTLAALAALIAALAGPAHAEPAKPAKAAKPEPVTDKPVAERPADPDAAHYCAAAAPAIVETRIAWQTKRLAELDAQVRQRIADLEKAEASARDWIAKRDAMMKAAEDDVVAIYAKMEPEAAARQIASLDDRQAAAILGKLKPNVAGAILGEMEAERASRLAGLIGAAAPDEKKS